MSVLVQKSQKVPCARCFGSRGRIPLCVPEPHDAARRCVGRHISVRSFVRFGTTCSRKAKIPDRSLIIYRLGEKDIGNPSIWSRSGGGSDRSPYRERGAYRTSLI